MTHLIYIYFIANAFLAGRNSMSRNIWIAISVLLLGIPLYIIDFIVYLMIKLFWKFNDKTFIVSFFRLWFTDRYKFFEIRMDYVKQRLIEGNWFERQFIRQLDKKYDYGITKEEQTK